MDPKNIKSSSFLNKVAVTPFYEPPPRKTSAEIINEARIAIRESQMADSSFVSTSIKPLQTQRPFTPRDKERLLFGKKIKTNRPPSSFSLRYLKNETEATASTENNTNNAVSNQRSSKIFVKKENVKTFRSKSLTDSNDKIFNIGVKELAVHKIKLPSLDVSKNRKKITRNNNSLDNLPEEYEVVQETKSAETRNAFSSPQERTNSTNDKNESTSTKSIKQKNLSQCLLLGPQNLNRIFENKQIIENSETLFVNTGYFNLDSNPKNNKKIQSFSVLDVTENTKQRTSDDVLKLLNSTTDDASNNEIVINLLSELYDCMEKENLLDNRISSKMKIHILKCLYKFVESQNEQLLLNIARIILALKVTGNNLSGVCKLLFKVSKNDKNDNLFFQNNILELFLDALGRSSPLDDAEACIYGYGAVKFLTMNPKLLEKILSLGILQLMVLHIKIINNAKIEGQIPEQTNHALYQLTGALRNVVSDESIYETFISSKAISQLCFTMDLFASDLDIISNISRTLSTISTNDCCCDAIAEYKDIYKILITLFDKYPGNEEIIVRLAYTLGNLVAKLDNTRIKFYNEDNSITSLITLWKIYLERTLKNCSLKFDVDEENSGNTEDVMIKIIRVIANTVINPEIGCVMNEKYGAQLIDEFLKVLISNPFKRNDELVLSILSTLNNLSYYYTSNFDIDIFHIKQIDIMEAITEYMKCKNKECVVESMRILGNLSRSEITRNYITKTELLEILIKTLEKDDFNLLRATTGVFVNLMADNRSRLLFKNFNGISKLISILSNHGQYDWCLAMLVCQVIWNFCIDVVDLYELFSYEEIQQLLSILADYLDEEKLFGITETNENNDIYMTQEYIVWEEFANVATNLLEKIEHFLDTFEDIDVKEIQTDIIKNTKDSSTNISFAAW